MMKRVVDIMSVREESKERCAFSERDAGFQQSRSVELSGNLEMVSL
jgi:hypothetical protein